MNILNVLFVFFQCRYDRWINHWRGCFGNFRKYRKRIGQTQLFRSLLFDRKHTLQVYTSVLIIQTQKLVYRTKSAISLTNLTTLFRWPIAITKLSISLLSNSTRTITRSYFGRISWEITPTRSCRLSNFNCTCMPWQPIRPVHHIEYEQSVSRIKWPPLVTVVDVPSSPINNHMYCLLQNNNQPTTANCCSRTVRCSWNHA